MMYNRKHIPIIVAHRANSRRRIRYFINNDIVDTIEIDVIKSPHNGSIILKHMDEDEFMRDFIVRNNEVELLNNNENIIKKVFSWINDKIRNSKTRKSKKYYLGYVLEYINGLSIMKNRKVNVIIDLKAKGVANEVASIIKSTKFNGVIYISSKYHKELTKIKHLVPQVKVLASFDGEPVGLSDYLRKIGVDGASVRAAFVDKDLINDLHSHGYIVAVWTVNDPELAKHLALLGVDMIITDIPETLKKVLELEEEYRAMQDEIDLDHYAESSSKGVVIGGLEHMFGYELGQQGKEYSSLRKEKPK